MLCSNGFPRDETGMNTSIFRYSPTARLSVAPIATREDKLRSPEDRASASARRRSGQHVATSVYRSWLRWPYHMAAELIPATSNSDDMAWAIEGAGTSHGSGRDSKLSNRTRNPDPLQRCMLPIVPTQSTMFSPVAEIRDRKRRWSRTSFRPRNDTTAYRPRAVDPKPPTKTR